MSALQKLINPFQPINNPMAGKEDKIFLAIIVILALVIRLDFLIPKDFVIDADEAIVGLMAKHIIEGAKIPAFYYGQHYMGSLEPLLVALSFSILGVSNITLKLVPLLFSLILIPILYSIGLEIGSRRTARIIAILAAIPPAPLIVWSAKARGGFIELIVIGALALLFTCRWLKSNPPALTLTMLIGALLGLGWWVNNQIIFFLPPIGYLFLGNILQQTSSIKDRLLLVVRHFLCGLMTFFIGGLPFWIYNFTHNFISFEIFNQAESKDILEHFAGLWHTALPIILGAKRFWTWHDAYPFSSLLVASFYILLLGTVIYQRRREIFSCVILRPAKEQPLELFLFFLISTFTIFALSSFGYLVEAPRYLLPSYIGIFVLSGYALDRLIAINRKVGLFLLVAALVINLSSAYLGGRAIPGEPYVFNGERVAYDHSELISWLEKNNYSWVRTNYWIGYRLAFETKERIRFSVIQAPHNVRIESYQRQAKNNAPESMPLILVPSQAKLIRRALRTMGFTFQESTLSGYAVLHSIVPSQSDLVKIDSTDLKVRSSHGQTSALLAVDGDTDTRWGSGSPQKTGMQFIIELGKPQALRALRYDLSEWMHDYPRGLRIDIKLTNDEIVNILDEKRYYPVRYYLENRAYTTFYFKPLLSKQIILTQTGQHPILDWSIAEVELFK